MTKRKKVSLCTIYNDKRKFPCVLYIMIKESFPVYYI